MNNILKYFNLFAALLLFFFAIHDLEIGANLSALSRFIIGAVNLFFYIIADKH